MNQLILNQNEKVIYLISEIVFNVENVDNIDTQYESIKQSISEIGFNNAANLYSVADTAKLGGKIGWIDKNHLSKNIQEDIKKIKVGEYTKPIIIPGGLLIVNLDDKKIQKENLDFNEEFNKQISFEKNSQLDQFSKIYFNKISIIKNNIQLVKIIVIYLLIRTRI